ncbi:hypothetical protein Nepgr_020944 [Nepenthes gracilis]|uniref:Uncharacterized protein n=1 Tax=Nepenthes gracilis TaxID=150966 RepID=A0AAD3SX30_NEPGR|nr:hypothetical protein Nepgr_020944 [Nepenthes gracilis]
MERWKSGDGNSPNDSSTQMSILPNCELLILNEDKWMETRNSSEANSTWLTGFARLRVIGSSSGISEILALPLLGRRIKNGPDFPLLFFF